MTSQRLVYAALLMSLTGCPSTSSDHDAGSADASAAPDAFTSDTANGRDDAGPACTTRTFDLALGETLVVDGDTGSTPGALDLDGCGPSAVPRAPQELLAFRLPRSGAGYAVNFEIVSEGTSPGFDTLVQVRTACDVPPASSFSTCFDDFGSPRSGGSFSARAGETAYLLITGKGSVDRGSYRMELEVSANEPPVLSAVAAEVEGADLVVRASGMDMDSNVTGVGVQFLDGEGRVLAIDGGMRVGPFLFDFAPAPTEVNFTRAMARVPGFSSAAALRDAVSARVFAYDALSARSATRDVAIGARPGLGERCDAALGCRTGYECVDATCAADAALDALCAAAESVILPAPTDTAVRVSRTFRLEGASAASGSCGGQGRERVIALSVPVTLADLRIHTNVPGATVDTVVYVRSR